LISCLLSVLLCLTGCSVQTTNTVTVPAAISSLTAVPPTASQTPSPAWTATRAPTPIPSVPPPASSTPTASSPAATAPTPVPSWTPIPPGGGVPLIAAVAQESDGGLALYAGHLGAGSYTRLAQIASSQTLNSAVYESAYYAVLRFSPDGRQLAFPVYGQRDPQLAIADLATGEIRYAAQLAGQRTWVGFMAWSPDGKWIAFTQCQFANNTVRCSLWLLNLAKPAVLPIAGNTGEAKWSADSSTIYYGSGTFQPATGKFGPEPTCPLRVQFSAATSSGYDPDLDKCVWGSILKATISVWLVDAKTNAPTLLLDYTDPSSNTLPPDFLLSPDGNALLLTDRVLKKEGEASAFFVKTIRLADSPLKDITPIDVSLHGLVWSPDSQKYLSVLYDQPVTQLVLSEAATSHTLLTSDLEVRPGARTVIRNDNIAFVGIDAVWPAAPVAIAAAFASATASPIPTATVTS
jgi:hypothetical protein